MSSNNKTTFGLFHAVLQFSSEEKLKAWQEEFLDFSAPGWKEKFVPISRIWMDDYPRTTLMGSSIGFANEKRLTLEDAREHFNESSTLRIEKEEIERMDSIKEGDLISYTFLLKGILPHSLKIKDFLTYLENIARDGEQYIELKYGSNSVEINAYLEGYASIEDHAELLFFMLMKASELDAKGIGFLVPDNYYFELSDFIFFKTESGKDFILTTDYLQNMDRELGKIINKVARGMQSGYEKWKDQA